MARIRYKASREQPYDGIAGRWLPGEVKDVANPDKAAHLLNALAEWFEPADPPAPPRPHEEEPKAAPDGARNKPARGRGKG